MGKHPNRKPMRLQGYDYSAGGAYHITICTKNKRCLLGKIVGEGLCALPQIELSDIGKQVEDSVRYIHTQWDGVTVDAYAIMPNHIHMLILANHTGGHGDPPLHEIIGRFKSYTTRCYGKPLWQRSYHDHIIRGKQDYDETRQYIETNPLRWVMKNLIKR